MKIKITAHIHFVKYHFEEKGEYQIYSCQLDDAEHRTYVSEQEIEIEVPDGYDPRAQQIAALEKDKQGVMAEFHKTITNINERISKLQALEYTA
jgi:hypothetical protein